MFIWLINAVLVLVIFAVLYWAFVRPNRSRIELSNLSSLGRFWFFLALFFTFSAFSFLVMNGGALWAELRYSLFIDTGIVDSSLVNDKLVDVTEPAQAQVVVSNTPPTAPDATPSPAPATSSVIRFTPLERITGSVLSIPKIGVLAPIVIASSNDNKAVLAALEGGVGLYPSTTPLGAPGRNVILGHSSRASWYMGKWAYVFSLLPQLKPGDEFSITLSGTKYTYEVFAQNVLSRDATNALLSMAAPDSEVDLITCYPVGSAASRKIVRGRLVGVDNGQ